jgi:hypothetical protein
VPGYRRFPYVDRDGDINLGFGNHVDTCRMTKQQNAPPLSSFDVFKVASKAIWLATIEATDERDAIERVAEERNLSANKLIAT